MTASVNRNLPQTLTELGRLLRHSSIVVSDSTSPAPKSAASGLSLLELLSEATTGAPHHAKPSGAKPSGVSLQSLSESLEHAMAIVGAPVCPIIAILGMLNAGKSSLVATFLSQPRSGIEAPHAASEQHASSATNATPSRVLIGSANAEGTHRFVLWLPQSWKDNATIWEYLQQQFRQVFGCECEFLSHDPVAAARQYNDIDPRSVMDAQGQSRTRNPLEIPLIATDPQLDRLGIALMDCPDIQTGLMHRGMNIPRQNARFDEASASIAEARFLILERAASLCSAFMVVLPANAMHDQTVSKLLRMLESRMPHVQRMLAVNRVPRRYRTNEIASEVLKLYRSANLRRVYMAYNFDGPIDRERLPVPPDDFPSQRILPLPCFFRVDKEPVCQPPVPVPDADWMIRLGTQLEGNALLADAMRSSVATLQLQTEQALAKGHAWLDECNRRAKEIHQVIADACVDFSLDPDAPPSNPKIRLQASRHIVQQIAMSLEKSAPWWAKPGRWVQRIASAGKETVGSATAWLKMPEWMLERGNAVGQWVRGRFHRGETGRVITADTLCDYLAKRDRNGILEMDDSSQCKEAVRAACQRAIDRFQQESLTQLAPEQIDAVTQQLWADMPMSQRFMSGIAPAGILFAPLLAVIMVPLDFGGSAVLVFASLKELLFAGAAGVGLALASSNAMPQIAESESAWQQLSDLIAVLTDELGLARPQPSIPTRVTLGSQLRDVGGSRIPSKPCERPDAPGRKLPLRRWNTSTAESIQSCLLVLERSQLP